MNIQRFFKSIWAVILTIGLWIGFPAGVQAGETVLNVYFFHSETCPHCIRQRPLMESIDRYNNDIDVHFIEVNQDPKTWQTFRERYNINSGGVPRTFIGDKSFIGYSEGDGSLEYNSAYSGYIGYRNQIIQAIADAVGHEVSLQKAIEQPKFQFPWWVLGLPILYLLSFLPLKPWLKTASAKRYWFGGFAAMCIVSLFLIVHLTPDVAIETFARGLPFPLFVSTIALADGFNPCAFTVLIILLSLLTHTKSRRDMALVGGTFITTSAVMYFLFIMVMIGLGSVLLEQYGKLFILVLGSGIAIAGIVNIKDYFWFKQGVSLSLSESQQRKISQKAGQIVRSLRESTTGRMRFLTALGGTILLAIFVNIIELGCTAILPAIYMTALVNYCTTNSGGVSLQCYSVWTALYAVIYVIPLLLILSSFIYSFESSRLTETQGRRLKLVGGLFMLFFGLVMIFRPGLLVVG
ncbi:MAG: thioredoxin family protein [Phormidium sp.]